MLRHAECLDLHVDGMVFPQSCCCLRSPELIVLNASNRIAVESYIRAPSRTLLVALLLVGPGAFADLDEVREPESDFVRPWLSLDANVLP